MILFKPDNVRAILNGDKTVTRRRWKRPRACVGSIHRAQTQLFGDAFARLRITSVCREEYPGASVRRGHVALMSEALKEGFISWDTFMRVWAAMHGTAAITEPCWRIEFELAP